MRVSALIAVTLGVLIFSQVANAWAPTRHQLGVRRSHVMDVRASKCLRTWSFKSNIADISQGRLGPLWRYWSKQLERANAAQSRCFTAVLWNWYNTSGAACVHSKEGSWTDPNAPYWGGFQADISFQRTYNPSAYYRYGTADHWPVIEQIKMAYYGWRSRGWYPWPNTARYCGLI